jgi:hypothetical protein
VRPYELGECELSSTSPRLCGERSKFASRISGEGQGTALITKSAFVDSSPLTPTLSP